MDNLPEKLQAARIKLGTQRPYLGSVLYAVQPVKTDGLGTFAVDKYFRLYFDPVLSWNVEECAVALEHECYHLLANHADRADTIAADPEKWNIAADCEINDDMIQAGRIFPKGYGVTPGKFGLPDNQLAEEYYGTLPTPPPQPQNGNGKDGQDKGQASPGNGKCGSASGTAQPWEQNAPGKKNEDGSPSAPGRESHDADLIRRKVARDIQSTQNRGDIPGWLQRWAENTLNPRVDWRRELEKSVSHAVTYAKGQKDYTYARPSRRASAVYPAILPALIKPIVNVAAVIDTSISMSDGALSAVVSEVRGILQHVASVDTIVTDATVFSHKRVTHTGQIKVGGGGGTDMRIGIKAALEAKVKPDIIVVLTDGYTPWPESPIAGVKIIAAIVGANPPSTPEFIKRIEVKD